MTSRVTLLDPSSREAIVTRYQQLPVPRSGYASVQDFCDSVDHLRPLCQMNGDLKDVQRPWTVKAVLATVPRGGRILEIGGGEPIVSGALAELGYSVTLVDPYDGGGNGPVEFEIYRARFPNVEVVRDIFPPKHLLGQRAVFDCICSVSVLEHVHGEALMDVFKGIRELVKPGGVSLHCVDSVVDGDGEDFHTQQVRTILREQARLADPAARHDEREYEGLVARLWSDRETFFLSAHGHQLWRGGTPYASFPFRKVVSIQTVARVAPA